ncbi:MAG: acyl-CoA dehydrogenase family protein [Myxococcota bacterium]
MSLVLTEEQTLLKETAAEFVQEKSPVTHLRELRDKSDATGFSRALWKEMSELGWAGILIPEEYGGSGLGLSEIGVILEECGRTLAPYPLLSTAVLGASALALGGSDAQKQALLPGVAQGETLLALAHQEKPRFAPYDIALNAKATSDGFELTGEKRFVLDGHVADRLIVVARTSGSVGEREGLTLFLVDPSASGVGVSRTNMVDSRNAANVRFENVVVTADDVLGDADRGADLLDALIERGTAAVSAELLGLIQEVFDRTVTYLKTRDQFGVKIGTFQALKHRAANMFSEVELSKSITIDALRAVDEERPFRERVVSAAKARTSDTAELVTREGLQMHGGIGMTDEEEIGLFMKRAKAAEVTFGDGGFHRDAFAKATGF